MTRRGLFRSLIGVAAATKLQPKIEPRPEWAKIKYVHSLGGNVTRLDILWGMNTIKPEYSARIVG